MKYNIDILKTRIYEYENINSIQELVQSIHQHDLSEMSNAISYIKMKSIVSAYDHQITVSNEHNYSLSILTHDNKTLYLSDINRDEGEDIEECFFDGTQDESIQISISDAAYAFYNELKISQLNEPKKSIQLRYMDDVNDNILFEVAL